MQIIHFVLFVPVAQSEEHLTFNQRAKGSNPFGRTIISSFFTIDAENEHSPLWFSARFLFSFCV